MRLKRVVDLPTVSESAKIYDRIRRGTMKCYEDKLGYVMFDEDELETYKPNKRGRPRKEY